MKKLVIFDLDGTLLNTIEDLAHSCNMVLARFDLPTYTLEEYKMFVGNGVMRLVEQAIPENLRTEEFVAQVRADFVHYYQNNISLYTTIYPHIVDMLRALQKEGIKIAVASNKFQSGTQKLVNHFFPMIHFEEVLGQLATRPLKPDPQIVYDILDKTSYKAEDVIYIGDSGVDMETARAAGVMAIGVTWGFRSREELIRSGANYVIDNADEILQFVK